MRPNSEPRQLASSLQGAVPHHAQHDLRLDDWTSWLKLSATPTVASMSDTRRKLHIRGGRIVNAETWPTEPASRIYVAFDDCGPVYVGQTTHPLLIRIRNHFANQRSESQRRKAGTWRFLVSAAWPDLQPGDLDRLERSAAEWLLPLRHRTGRRHPRST